ncbi:hypothetical protein LAU42_08835 [Macrococcus armenti]|uniref:hypothetical protein n=1 Tax=Macrococcus armenti TaxID=2875764 RepID=UPI001CCF4928|nr:hypothetical protein [Macrococcus armenti]UBH21871.1 hypothetical protein LAU42_08835 [Macrococcus armenti]
MCRGVTERGFVQSHLRGSRADDSERRINETTREAEIANKEANRFTYAELFSDCYRYLGINDVNVIKRMTIAEYKALRHGSLLRYIDELETMYTQAYSTAMAGGFDKDGKPLIKSFKDLFDRKDVERRLLGDLDIVKKEPVNSETVEKFRLSKERAEDILNGIITGREDD